MKKLFLLFFTVVSTAVIVSCSSDDEFTPPNYVTFERNITPNVGVAVGGDATREITVYTANITDNDRTFDLVAGSATTLDPSGYTLPESVTVPGGTNEATFTVGVSDVNLGITGKKLAISLQPTAGLSVGDPYVINVNRTCVGSDFVIAFVFDGYASEISWSLADEDGNVVVTGGGYADGVETFSRSLCLDQGTYTFTVEDSYGDGLTYPTTGSVTLSYAGEELVVIPGDFGAEESVEVTF